MLVPRSHVRLMLLLTVVACSSEREPTVPHNLRPALNAGQGVQLHASGGGIVDFSLAGVGDGYFSFTANAKGDGSANGHFRQRRTQGDLIIDFEGRVTCLTVDPVLHRARIGGVVTKNNSTHPGFLTENHEVGDDVWFRVEDGDEATGGVDMSTTYGFKPVLVNTSAEYCALPFTGPLWNPNSIIPLASGNIQVRP